MVLDYADKTRSPLNYPQMNHNMTGALPTKLGKEPLIEAVFELRFDADVPASEVLPGVLFSHLQDGQHGKVAIRRNPASSMPEQLRLMTPDYRFMPLTTVELERYWINIGQSSVSIMCKLPYAGGSAFKDFILNVIGRLSDLNIVRNILRYSMKFIDVIPQVDHSNLSETFKVSVEIAGQKVTSEHTVVRVELPFDGRGVHAVQMISIADISLFNGETRSGALLEVDSIVLSGLGEANQFFNDLPTLLHDLRMANKKIFFDCLTRAALSSLEPTYD